jgi:hypothetical protein
LGRSFAGSLEMGNGGRRKEYDGIDRKRSKRAYEGRGKGAGGKECTLKPNITAKSVRGKRWSANTNHVSQLQSEDSHRRRDNIIEGGVSYRRRQYSHSRGDNTA